MEQSEEWHNEFGASDSKVLPKIQTQSASNVPPMSETTSSIRCSLQDVVEAPSTSLWSQTSQRGHMRVQSKKPKRITWTEEEHRRFLEALDKYEKGNWKKISAYIQTKNTTQVASHAQKYFIRQRRSEEQRRRKSIHDMVLENTANHTNIHAQNSSSSKTSPAISQFNSMQSLEAQPLQSIRPTQSIQMQPCQMQPQQVRLPQLQQAQLPQPHQIPPQQVRLQQPHQMQSQQVRLPQPHQMQPQQMRLSQLHQIQSQQVRLPQPHQMQSQQVQLPQPPQSVHHTQSNQIRPTHSFNNNTQFSHMQPAHQMINVNSNNIIQRPPQFNQPTTNVIVQSNKRKRITWTEAEHKRFLEGLHKYGKGDWKNISAYIQTKTAIQVASHAQKYFIRQAQTQHQKKRKSIHDMVMENAFHMQNSSSSGASSQFSDVQPLPFNPHSYNPVSYTHLDVYKRQVMENAFHMQTSSSSGASSQFSDVQPLPFNPHSYNPVSYTHLDVYKRQVMENAFHMQTSSSSGASSQFSDVQPLPFNPHGRKLGFRVENGSKNEISGEERKKGNTRSKGERKKGERKKGERRKEERKKGEDEERRRREKSFLPDLRFFFVSIVGFLFVKNEKREKKERKGKPSRKEKGRKENTCVVVSRKRRREKTKREDEGRRRREKTFVNDHNTVILDEACEVRVCGAFSCSIQAVVGD
ncbi:transcription factor [Vigna unguiculata]|uniref:Transcription factor n=1 Tax=Vigna unguiculata TaxID=3917 RepID=A0A4D6KKN1_VIGUN|nr:transcription factor [Vigna unguiculata]